MNGEGQLICVRARIRSIHDKENGERTQKEAELKSVTENPQEVMKEKTFKDLPDYQLTQAFNILRAFSLGDLFHEETWNKGD
jgi:hypothetical protein